MLTNLIERAQKKVEGMHFSMRKYLLQLDTVMDSQRKAIYEHRDWILSEDDISDHLREIYEDVVSRRVNMYTQETDWDFKGLKQSLKAFPVDFSDLKISDFNNFKEIEEEVFERLFSAYKAKKEEIGEEFTGLQKFLLLKIVDERWRKHLESTDKVKEGINLRAFGQRDPVMEYKKEANRLFDEMIDSIYDDMAIMLLHVAKINSDEATEKAQDKVDSLQYTHDDVESFNRKQRRKKTKVTSNKSKKKRFKVKR